jgi:hypothetical protein
MACWADVTDPRTQSLVRFWLTAGELVGTYLKASPSLKSGQSELQVTGYRQLATGAVTGPGRRAARTRRRPPHPRGPDRPGDGQSSTPAIAHGGRRVPRQPVLPR